MESGEQGEDRGRLEVGARGERVAAAYLEERGWEIVEANWSVAAGEIDLIASRPRRMGARIIRQIAIVEVKTRRARPRLPPEASVTWRKRRRLVALARLWRRGLGHGEPVALRFDVIAVELGSGSQEPAVRHYPAAFDARGRLA